MTREDARLNQINLFFEEAVHLHGGDVKKVVSYVKSRIGAASRQDRADIDRVFERLLAFRGPGRRPEALN